MLNGVTVANLLTMQAAAVNEIVLYHPLPRTLKCALMYGNAPSAVQKSIVVTKVLWQSSDDNLLGFICAPSPKFMSKTLSVQSGSLQFNVRLVFKGDKYGKDFCLSYDETDDPMVEFYDARYPHTEFGQFVSRYCVSTLLSDAERLAKSGLCLNGGVPDWVLDSASISRVFTWIHEEISKSKTV